MTARVLEARHELVVHDRSPEAVAASVGRGARGSESLSDPVSRLDGPRVVWLMVPTGTWRFGSVVRSWLLDLTARPLEQDPELADIRGFVADSGEGRWMVGEAIDLDVPAPVMTTSPFMRFVSRQDDSFASKLLAAMRNQFGRHDFNRVERAE